MTAILGISCYYHDSAACLLQDGKLLAAVHEERFTRCKHDKCFPKEAIKYCLESQMMDQSSIDYVVYYEKPILSFDRVLTTFLTIAPKGLPSWLNSVPGFLRQRFALKQTLKREIGYTGDILYTEHHEAHAASAFYPSPFEKAAVLTVDGVGEWATTAISHGEDSRLELVKQMEFPDSLGLLYSAFTYFSGFKVNSGEYKLMGLAPYGTPVFKEKILDNLLNLRADGSFRLNMEYFDFLYGHKMVNEKFHRLFDLPPRDPEGKIERCHADLAASIQSVTSEILLKMVCHAKELTGAENLCMAGGVALNCVANSYLLREGPFKNIWIQPASGDAGGALGAAYSVYHRMLGKEREPCSDMSCYLGPAYDDHEILAFLEENNIPSHHLKKDTRYTEVAKLINSGKVVGYMNGNMEFGPRALGSRSILGDPRNVNTQHIINSKIKFRESFRPFAPVVIEEKAEEYFDFDLPSPYMLFIASIVKEKRIKQDNHTRESIYEQLDFSRSDIPAVTHVDYSARLQTVNEKMNKDFYKLLNAFYDQTGCAVLVNTSFNVRGEPIVCSPEDAFRCFMHTDMDVVVMGDHLLYKEDQSDFSIDSKLSVPVPTSSGEIRHKCKTPLIIILILLSIACYFQSARMIVILSIFLLMNLCMFIWPGYFGGLYRFLDMMLKKVQTVLSKMILSSVYFFVVSPMALIKRFFSSSLMSCPKSASYWKSKEGFQEEERFYKQY
jgi:carbamoyltransferase